MRCRRSSGLTSEKTNETVAHGRRRGYCHFGAESSVVAEVVEWDRNAPVVDHLPHRGVDGQFQASAPGHVPVVDDYLLEVEHCRTRCREGSEGIGAVALKGTWLAPAGEVLF